MKRFLTIAIVMALFTCLFGQEYFEGGFETEFKYYIDKTGAAYEDFYDMCITDKNEIYCVVKGSITPMTVYVEYFSFENFNKSYNTYTRVGKEYAKKIFKKKIMNNLYVLLMRHTGYLDYINTQKIELDKMNNEFDVEELVLIK